MPSTIRKAKNPMTYFRVLSMRVKNLSIAGYLLSRRGVRVSDFRRRAGPPRAGGRLVNLDLDDGERVFGAAAAGGRLRVGRAGYLDDVAEGVAVAGAARQLDAEAARSHGREGEGHVAEAARRDALEDDAVAGEDADGVGLCPPARELQRHFADRRRPPEVEPDPTVREVAVARPLGRLVVVEAPRGAG